MDKIKVEVYRRRNLTDDVKTVNIPPSTGGHKAFSVKVDKSGKRMHNILCDISVNQPPNKSDLDIRLYVMDDQNFHYWLGGYNNQALVLVPKIIQGTVIFTPPASGEYHIILDNKYSTFTEKNVSFSVYEIWTEEQEIEIPIVEKVVEKIVEKPIEIKPSEQSKLSDRILSWLKRPRQWFQKLKQQKIILVIILFSLSFGISISTFLGTVYLISKFLRISFKDTFDTIGTSSIPFFLIGGLALFAIFYKSFTGEPIHISPSSIRI